MTFISSNLQTRLVKSIPQVFLVASRWYSEHLFFTGGGVLDISLSRSKLTCHHMGACSSMCYVIGVFTTLLFLDNPYTMLSLTRYKVFIPPIPLHHYKRRPAFGSTTSSVFIPTVGSLVMGKGFAPTTPQGYSSSLTMLSRLTWLRIIRESRRRL